LKRSNFGTASLPSRQAFEHWSAFGFETKGYINGGGRLPPSAGQTKSETSFEERTWAQGPHQCNLPMSLIPVGFAYDIMAWRICQRRQEQVTGLFQTRWANEGWLVSAPHFQGT